MSGLRVPVFVVAVIMLATKTQFGAGQIALDKLDSPPDSLLWLCLLTLFGSAMNGPLFTQNRDSFNHQEFSRLRCGRRLWPRLFPVKTIAHDVPARTD